MAGLGTGPVTAAECTALRVPFGFSIFLLEMHNLEFLLTGFFVSANAAMTVHSERPGEEKSSVVTVTAKETACCRFFSCPLDSAWQHCHQGG